MGIQIMAKLDKNVTDDVILDLPHLMWVFSKANM